MRLVLQRSAAVVLAAAVLCVHSASADAVRVLATDAGGVTLRLDTGAWSLTAPDPAGTVRIVGVPEAHSLADPGHALLPAWSALLAVPADARPTVRVLASAPAEVRTAVRLEIAGKPAFRPDGAGRWEPADDDVVPALTDGAWPVQSVQMGEPVPFRGRRLVGVELRPFRYDAANERLEATTSITVRVDFHRPAGASASAAGTGAADPHVDAVLASSVLNFAQAAPWRTAPARASRPLFGARPSGAAAAIPPGFDESQPEVRVQVDSTALHLLAFDNLAAHGYPAGVPVAQVSVHRHEFLDAANPPYATYEIPVEVEDANGNGTFDSGDRIWMFVRNWAERSSASRYQRWWGDADMVYVTVKPAGGLRMTERQGWRGASNLTPLASFPHFQHWELNGAGFMPYVPTARDTTTDLFHWTSYQMYYDRPDSIRLGINDPDPSHQVQFRTSWVGRDNSGRFIWAAIKNPAGQVSMLADSIYFSGKYPITFSTTLPGTAITHGIDRFLAWGRTDLGRTFPVSTDLALAGLNWIEATYWRSFRAVHDVLWFNSADASDLFQVHATGFYSDSLRVYDITDPDQPVRLRIDATHRQYGAGGGFDLQDSVASLVRRSYVAAAAQEPLDPAWGPQQLPDDHYFTVTRRNLYATPAADYLMIVPEAFLAAAQPLADRRAAQGLGVLVAPAEAVYDEFNGGRHSAAAIQRFVKYAYDTWGSQYLLLVGDGTLDPLDTHDLAGKDWVPVLPMPAPVWVNDGYEMTPSDNRYACLTGNCDPIYATNAFLPEMMIGRLPANSPAEVTAMVDKIAAFEDTSGDPAWRRHLLLSSDDAFSGETTFGGGGGGSSNYCEKSSERRFVRLNQKCQSIIVRDAGLARTDAELFNLRYYLANEHPNIIGTDTCRTDRSTTRTYVHAAVTPAMFTKLNAGTLWWNYQGHANEYVLTHEDLYTNVGDFTGSDDKFQFTNNDRPLIYTAFSCHANMFARPEGGEGGPFGGCLGEDMVTLPQRGAVASWASSSYEEVPRDDSSHVNVELARAMFADPPHDPLPWDRGARLVLGEAIQATFLRYLTKPGVNLLQFERGIGVTYTLLGDPALRVSIGRPQTLVTANDTAVVDQQPVRLHSPLDTLSLVADLVSTARIDTLGLYVDTGAGYVALPASAYDVTPAFPDTANGGIWGGRRFRLHHFTHLPPVTQRYLVRTRDRDGLLTDFTTVFVLDATLRADGAPVADGDDVSPVASLSALLVSPAPLVPANDIEVTLNGQPVTVTAVPAPGDNSGREWLLSWSHAPFVKDDYTVRITVRGGQSVVRRFTVSTATGELKLADLYAFPNPFDNDGTAFSFRLLGSDPADVKITVLTLSGRPIHSVVVRGLGPGYHQVPWDGRDAEGSVLANGVYFYRLSVVTAAGRHVEQVGRLVKLRKPRHVDPNSP